MWMNLKRRIYDKKESEAKNIWWEWNRSVDFFEKNESLHLLVFEEMYIYFCWIIVDSVMFIIFFIEPCLSIAFMFIEPCSAPHF